MSEISEHQIFIDLHFPVFGTYLPRDHAYPLFGGLCQMVPELHDADWLGINRIIGDINPVRENLLCITRESKLRVRAPLDKIPVLYRLAGKKIRVQENSIQLGAPSIVTLRPKNSLRSPIVIVKPAHSSATPSVTQFLSCVNRQLETLGIDCDVQIESSRNDLPEPKKRCIRIAGVTLIGYALSVSGLTESNSIVLQQKGLGGRRKFGCGIFNPMRAHTDKPTAAEN